MRLITPSTRLHSHHTLLVRRNTNSFFAAQKRNILTSDRPATGNSHDFQFEMADLYINRHREGADEVIARMKAANTHMSKLNLTTQDAFRKKTVEYVNKYFKRLDELEMKGLSRNVSSNSGINAVSKVYHAMGVYTFEANLDTFALILSICAKDRNQRFALSVFEDLAIACRNARLKLIQNPDQRQRAGKLMNQVLKVCKDDVSVFRVYNTMKDLGFQADEEGFGALLHACRMSTDIKRAKAIFADIQQQEIIRSSHLSIMINFCVRIHETDFALELIFKVGEERDTFPNAPSLSKLFAALYNSDHHQALDLFRFLHKHGVTLSSSSYENLLSVCVAWENTEAAREVVQHMIDNNITINSPSSTTERIADVLLDMSDTHLQEMIKTVLPTDRL